MLAEPNRRTVANDEWLPGQQHQLREPGTPTWRYL